MGYLGSFKMPKFNTGILPSLGDLGINTGKTEQALKDISGSLDLKGSFDLTKFPDIKGKALDVVKNIPKPNGISLVSLIPTEMFESLDLKSMQNDINTKLGDFGLGGIEIPNDIGSAVKDITSGKTDFLSLYSMPKLNVGQYNLDSEFNLNELTTEIDTIGDIASNEFDVSSYLNEFSNIQ